ncbi:MAG: PAS domain S-box protein [Rhodospirillales bacterium]|nr:PAS domain S-box protein [Rhodospirillales bacterium]
MMMVVNSLKIRKAAGAIAFGIVLGSTMPSALCAADDVTAAAPLERAQLEFWSGAIPGEPGAGGSFMDSLILALGTSSLAAVFFAGWVSVLKFEIISLGGRSDRRRLEASDGQKPENGHHDGEVQFRAFVENSTDTIARYDLNARRLYANPKLKNMINDCGIDMRDGLTRLETGCLETSKEYQDAILYVARSGEVLDIEMPWVTSSGETFFTHVRAVPECGADGEVVSVLAIGHDISVRKRLEAELREAVEKSHLESIVDDEVTSRSAADFKDRQMAAILENLPDIAWVKDLDSRFIAVSTALAKMCGYSDTAMLKGKTDLDLFPRGQAEAFRADDAEVIYSKTSIRSVEPITHADGTLAWIDTLKAPILDGVGNVIGTVGMARDISARKAMEDELRETSVRLESIIDNIPGVIYRKIYSEDDSRMVFLSDHASRMYGSMTEKLFEMNQAARISMLWKPEDQQAITGMSQRIADGATVSEARARIVDAQGTYKWMLVREVVTGVHYGEIIVTGIMLDIDDQVRAEEQSVLLSAALNVARELAVLYDETGRIVYVNDAACRATGYVKDELLSMTIPDIVEDIGAEDWSDHWQEVTAKRSMTNEVTHRRKDGTLYPAEVSISLVSYQGCDMILSLSRDITVRKVLAEKLRASNARLEGLVTNLPGLIFLKRYDEEGGRVIYTSNQDHADDNINAMSDEELVKAYWHPDDQEAVLRSIQTMVSATSGYEVRARLKNRDGSYHWMLLRERFMEKQDGAILTTGLILDIDAQVRVEEAFRETSQMLETIILNLPGSMFRMRYDANDRKRVEFTDGGLIRRVPGLREKLYSISHEEFMALYSETDRKILFEDFPKALRENGFAEGVVRLPFEDGRVIWVRILEKAVAFEGDEMVTEGIVLDVTNEVLANKVMEQEAAERARLNNLLAEERRMRALGDLAGGIAHEFNNMLGAIDGFAKFIAEDERDNKSFNGYANRILAVSKRGQELVEQVSILTGRKQPSYARLGLADLICCMAEGAFSAGLWSVDESFEWSVDESLDIKFEIEADCDLLQLALWNLYLNGVSASGGVGVVTLVLRPARLMDEIECRLLKDAEHEITLAVESWVEGESAWAIVGNLAPGKEYVSFAVSDEGEGMNVDLLKNAFLPFFSTRGRAVGTGLGLAVVQGVTLMHGGALVVHSIEKRGTTVELLMPVVGSTV